MENRATNRIGKRIAGILCFIVAAVITTLAVWLCVLGEVPAIKTGDHSYMILGGMSINGVDMPAGAFYFIPGVLFAFGVGLWLIGWCVSMRGRDDA